MTEEEVKAAKILFRFYSDLLEQEATETLWAVTEDQALGYYRINNLPFYVPALATDDLVLAEWDDEEGMLLFRHVVQPSGNSTIWVVMMDDQVDLDDVRKIMHDLGCYSEAVSDQYFSMEVLADVNYLRIRDELNRLRSEGIIDYAEPCLSANHQY